MVDICSANDTSITKSVAKASSYEFVSFHTRQREAAQLEGLVVV